MPMIFCFMASAFCSLQKYVTFWLLIKHFAYNVKINNFQLKMQQFTQNKMHLKKCKNHPFPTKLRKKRGKKAPLAIASLEQVGPGTTMINL